MASRLCRETQTSLCIKNPANITAIRKQQQQYQYIPGSSLYERDFFIFSCYNTRYLGDQSKESEGIWGQLIFRKCTISIRYTDSACYCTLISRYVLSIEYICYRLFTNFQNFLFFPSQRASEEDIGRTCTTQQRSSSGGDPLEIQQVPKILFHYKI